jgi:hypothetical protein
MSPSHHTFHPYWNWSAVSRVAVIAALTLFSVAGPTAHAGRGQAVGNPTSELLVSDGPTLEQFSATDSETLAESPTAALVPAGFYDRVVSVDGTTLASRITRAGNEIVVQDAFTGAEHARIPAPAGASRLLVSRDGARLVVEQPGDAFDSRAPSWTVFDARSGQLLTRFSADHPSASPAVIDQSGSFLYQLALPARQTGLQPVELFRYDLLTGAPSGRVVLEDVLAGSWQTDKALFGEPLGAVYAPGLAVSPGGGQLAIAHAESATVTMIAADSLAIERSAPIEQAQNTVNWLFAEQTAFAKQPPQGVSRSALFSPEGDRVFVWGRQTEVNEDGRLSRYDHFGLAAMDVQTGTLLGEALQGHWIQQVVPSLDGQNLYVIGLEDPCALSETDTSPYLLRRLNASNLTTLTQREMVGFHSLLVRGHP